MQEITEMFAAKVYYSNEAKNSAQKVLMRYFNI